MEQTKLQILDLFTGSGSMANVARELGHTVFTSDYNSKLKGIDYVVDILEFDVSIVPFVPKVITASPDCATWSKAPGSLYFPSKSLVVKKGNVKAEEKAKLAFKHILKMLEIIYYFKKLNPNLLYYIENPQGGKLRYFLMPGPLFNKLDRMVTLDQCQYGREFKKRTEIFTNNLKWQPRPLCTDTVNCHARNIKNYGSGYKDSLHQLSNKSYYLRAMLPADLCREILENSFIN